MTETARRPYGTPYYWEALQDLNEPLRINRYASQHMGPIRVQWSSQPTAAGMGFRVSINVVC